MPEITNEWAFLIGVLLVVGIVVGFYAKYVSVVALVLVAIAGFVFLSTTLAFLVLWWKRCVDGASVAWRLLLGVFLLICGLLSTVWLERPPLHASAIQEAREAVNGRGLLAVLFLKNGAFPQVAYQFLGAFLTLIMLIALIALCLAAVAGVYVADDSSPEWLWLVVFWVNKWAVPVGVWIGAAFLGTFAMLLTSGVFYDWVASAPQPNFPIPTP